MDNAILQYMTKTEIGIFFKDTQWKDRIFEKLVKDATECSSIQYIKRNEICFSDMFIYIRIRFCSANESARGHKFDRIYYQYGINEDTLSMLIKPMLIKGIFPLETIETDVESS